MVVEDFRYVVKVELGFVDSLVVEYVRKRGVKSEED